MWALTGSSITPIPHRISVGSSSCLSAISKPLHELTKEEFQELAEIEYKLVQVTRTDPSVQKEYLMCFAEGEGFHHVHIHVVPKPADLPVQFKGPRVFALLTVDEEHAIAAQELTAFCEEFTRGLGAIQ